jgi:hypothetical protein
VLRRRRAENVFVERAVAGDGWLRWDYGNQRREPRCQGRGALLKVIAIVVRERKAIQSLRLRLHSDLQPQRTSAFAGDPGACGSAEASATLVCGVRSLRSGRVLEVCCFGFVASFRLGYWKHSANPHLGKAEMWAHRFPHRSDVATRRVSDCYRRSIRPTCVITLVGVGCSVGSQQLELVSNGGGRQCEGEIVRIQYGSGDG